MSEILKNKAENFPLSGVYEGQHYRIDGDSVMLRLPNGREMQIGPLQNVDIKVYEDSIAHALKVEIPQLMPVTAYCPSSVNAKQRHGRQVLSWGKKFTPEEMWGISEQQESWFLKVGKAVLFNFHKAKWQKRT